MFADAEALVVQFLEGLLGDVPVATKVPNPRPATFVRAWRTGGAAVNRVLDRPLITVQAWGPDSVTASKLAGRCRDMMLSASGRIPLVRLAGEPTGLYFDPDPDTGCDRYTFTHQLSVRATF